MNKRIKIKPIYIVIVVAIFALFLPGYAKFMELRAKNIYLEKESERLEQENVALSEEKQRLEEDIDYIEKVARDTIGVAKEGEIPITIEE